MKYKMM